MFCTAARYDLWTKVSSPVASVIVRRIGPGRNGSAGGTPGMSSPAPRNCSCVAAARASAGVISAVSSAVVVPAADVAPTNPVPVTTAATPKFAAVRIEARAGRAPKNSRQSRCRYKKR